MGRLGRKWRNYRRELFKKHYDHNKSREENILDPPENISEVMWGAFIDYRLNPKTRVLSKFSY